VGPRGLAQVAAAGHANATALVEKLTRVPGVSRAFSSPIFHEAVLRLPLPAAEVLTGLAAQNILGGFFLKADFPELGEAILVCATETKVEADLDRFSAALEQQVLSRRALPLQAQQG
jgi:glycine dehydrogenase subunit 1